MTTFEVLSYCKWAWLALDACGVAAGLRTFALARVDRKLVCDEPCPAPCTSEVYRRWRARQRQAWSFLRLSGVIFFVQLAFFGVRTWNLYAGDSVSRAFAESWIIRGSILTAAQMALAIECLLQNRDRHTLLHRGEC